MSAFRPLETGPKQFCPVTEALHSSEPAGVIVLAAAHGADDRHFLRGAIREMLLEPGPEQRRDFPGQPHRQIKDGAGARVGRRFDQRLKLVICDPWNDWG